MVFRLSAYDMPIPRKLYRFLIVGVLLLTCITFLACLLILCTGNTSSTEGESSRLLASDRHGLWAADRVHTKDARRPVKIAQHTADPEEAYRERVQHLRDVCQHLSSLGVGNTALLLPPAVSELPAQSVRVESNFFVSPDHNLVYCPVQKVASSFWKRVFRVLNKGEPPRSVFQQSGLLAHTHNENITFRNKSLRWQREQMEKSLKFLFVRDPFSRTFSGYMDKLFLPFGADPVRIYNETTSVRDPSNGGQNVTRSIPHCQLEIPSFAKFLQLSFSTDHSVFSYEDHFTPIHSHCNPCAVPFDFVGKLEFFREDTEYILSKVGVKLADITDDLTTFDARSDLNILTDITRRTLSSPAWKKLQQESSCVLARHEMLKRLWTVFQARSLLSTSVKFPLSVEQSSEATLPDVLLAVKNGYDASGSRSRRLLQREAAMIEAYRTVSIKDLRLLQLLHSRDCAMFGYDCSLDRFIQAPNSSSVPGYTFCTVYLLIYYLVFTDW